MKGINLDKYLVEQGSKVSIADFDPDESLKIGKDAAKAAHLENVARMNELQEIMFAENKHKLLVVLQAMDSAGKDSTIRQVFGPLNPQGVQVTGFGKPTEEELAHDYLWRVHQHVPPTGKIGVFNRSHYEDVLCVRVHDYVPKSQWSKRYTHIKNFEKMLYDEGTTILKFYLNISNEEQFERLKERIDIPHKNWKAKAGDWEERKLWPEYMRAFEEAMSRTSTKSAPWYVVPANRKWSRNYVVSSIVVEALENMDMQYPPPEKGLDKIVLV